MEGVPVRISDRCRPPEVDPPSPRIAESCASAGRVVADSRYDFGLETAVLRRLDEWKEARARDKKDRDERIRLADEARCEERQRAAEAERELQRMHLAEVTYPSTEDLKEETEPQTIAPPTPTPPSAEPSSEASSDGILRPTPVARVSATERVDLLDDLDPVANFQRSMLAKPIKFNRINGLHKKNVDEMTFSDFENDTSSPFDNLELKSINDLELLAQVLNNQPSNNFNADRNVNADSDASRTAYAGTDSFSPPSAYSYSNNPYQNTVSDNYFSCDNKMPQTFNFNANNYYAPNYGYSSTNPIYGHVPNNYAATNNVTHESMKPNDCGMPRYDPETPYKYYVNYMPAYNPYGDVSNFQSECIQTVGEPESEIPSDSASSKPRSKSVPDIVKALDEELNEARLRLKERSHNCSPAPSRQIKLEPSVSQTANMDKLPDPFNSLAPKLQMVCKSISNMGFPMDRVARACEDIGDDDKKIIEYLLIMGQLMDLGFTETKVAKALLQNNCNRDKALDELIS